MWMLYSFPCTDLDEPGGIVCYPVKLIQPEVLRFILFSLSVLGWFTALAMLICLVVSWHCGSLGISPQPIWMRLPSYRLLMLWMAGLLTFWLFSLYCRFATFRINMVHLQQHHIWITACSVAMRWDPFFRSNYLNTGFAFCWNNYWTSEASMVYWCTLFVRF
jgi:hypothetical protein